MGRREERPALMAVARLHTLRSSYQIPVNSARVNSARVNQVLDLPFRSSCEFTREYTSVTSLEVWSVTPLVGYRYPLFAGQCRRVRCAQPAHPVSLTPSTLECVEDH